MNESYMEKIKRFRPIDNTFFKVFARSEEVVGVITGALLHKNIEISHFETEASMQNISGRTVEFDLYVQSVDDIHINIEVEKSKERALPKRARLHSASLTSSITYPGQEYDKLQETYVVFMTERHIFQDDNFVHHIERRLEKSNKAFNDADHIIYVDCSRADDSPLGRIAHDMLSNDPEDMYNPVLRDRARYFKETKEGIKEMCVIMDEFEREIIDINKPIWIEKGMVEEKLRTASRMLNDGMDIAIIVKYTSLSFEEVLNLKNEIKCNIN